MNHLLDLCDLRKLLKFLFLLTRNYKSSMKSVVFCCQIVMMCCDVYTVHEDVYFLV